MIAARRREHEYFASSPDYRHLANRMGSEHLGKMLSKVCMVSLMEFIYGWRFLQSYYSLEGIIFIEMQCFVSWYISVGNTKYP